MSSVVMTHSVGRLCMGNPALSHRGVAVEPGSRSERKPGKCRDIELDHLVEIVRVGLEQLVRRGDSGVVDQRSDGAIGCEAVGDSMHVRWNGEVSRQGLNL